MSFLNHYKKKIDDKVSLTGNDLAFDKSNWDDLFSASLGKVLANQMAFYDQITKDKDWNIDLSRGNIKFGSQEFPIQFIGSYSNLSNSWLWGWENINGFPEKVLRSTHYLHDIGIKENIPNFIEPQFNIGEQTKIQLNVITCALADVNTCYYEAHHDQ